ncbi:M56 family metallopeptidase [Sphingopyxis sp. J-6]|uniref:M56 family metallopeptidase n=1 Tax=Sphingopyxis sp. J-6 TaxID=3122054 RepID=UPI0039841677
MSAAVLMQAWGDTMLATAILVLAVLVVRKPFARHFGPRLTYALWLVPALRLILPPLPFADPVVTVPVDAALLATVAPVTTVVSAADAPVWSVADAAPLLFALWAAGAIAVLASALLAHHRFRAAVLRGGVELEAVGKVRLVMSEAVDGPVAFGLLRPYVAVPRDFFARYAAEERALAIDHELTHHRHGDLWANAAALLLLAAQWFNPFAWRALRAFRFDQEAACDARVLTMADTAPRDVRTARYATAIAKAAVGARLSLAAPMAVHDNLQERLTMLMRQDISKRRGLAGRLLVGGVALGILATTATLVPAGIASASVQPADMPEPPAPPPPPAAPLPPDAPLPPEAPAAPDAPHGVMLVTSGKDGVTEQVWTSDDGSKREVRRITIREGGDDSGSTGDRGATGVRHLEFAMPGGLSRDDVIATLREQGITGTRAEAIADKLEAKRKARFRTALAPLPPMPPMPPMPAAGWAPVRGQAMAIARCGDGSAPPAVDREENDGGKRSRFVMIACADGPGGKAARLSALKKARDNLRQNDGAMSDTMRAKVAADLDKAIAETEKSGD